MPNGAAGILAARCVKRVACGTYRVWNVSRALLMQRGAGSRWNVPRAALGAGTSSLMQGVAVGDTDARCVSYNVCSSGSTCYMGYTCSAC